MLIRFNYTAVDAKDSETGCLSRLLQNLLCCEESSGEGAIGPVKEYRWYAVVLSKGKRAHNSGIFRLSRNSRENRTSFEGQPNISNALAR
jgi:hypothetical protein